MSLLVAMVVSNTCTSLWHWQVMLAPPESRDDTGFATYNALLFFQLYEMVSTSHSIESKPIDACLHADS